MPAYGMFASYYDALNEDADYDKLEGVVCGILRKYGIHDGIVADLGCGTGELTLRLAKQGYDMIAIDASPDMLNMLRDKMADQNQKGILLLCQQLEELDLYGTIRAAVSTFDTFNHLPPAALKKCLARTALFMEQGGLLVFDMNTQYKHETVLADNIFEVESERFPGVVCEWENTLKSEDKCTDIYLEFTENNKQLFLEQFTEYYYLTNDLMGILEDAGFHVEAVLDGETFASLTDESQRVLIAAKRL